MNKPFSNALRNIRPGSPSEEHGAQGDVPDDSLLDAAEIPGDPGQAAEHVLNQMDGSGGGGVDPTSIASVAADGMAEVSGSFDTQQSYSNFGLEPEDLAGADVDDVTATATGAIIAKVMQRKLDSGLADSEDFAPRIQELPAEGDAPSDASMGTMNMGDMSMGTMNMGTMVIDSGGGLPAPSTPVVTPPPQAPRRTNQVEASTKQKRLIINENDLLKASRDRVIIIPRGNNTVIRKSDGFGSHQDAFAEAPPEAPVMHVTAMAVPTVAAPVHQEIAENPTKVPKSPAAGAPEGNARAAKPEVLKMRSADSASPDAEDQWNDKEEREWQESQVSNWSQDAQPTDRPVTEDDFLTPDDAGDVPDEELSQMPDAAPSIKPVRVNDLGALVPGFDPGAAKAAVPKKPAPTIPEAAVAGIPNIKSAQKPTRVPRATPFEKEVHRLLKLDQSRKEFEAFAELISGRLDPPYGTSIAISHVDEQQHTDQVIAAIGMVLAAQGHRTLIVDADVRTSSLSEKYGVTENEGFGETCDRHQLWQHLCRPTSVKNLSILPGGTCADRSFLEFNRLRRLFTAYSKGPYTAVLVAVGEVSDGCTSTLCEVSDVSHVLVRLGRTSRKRAQEVIEQSQIRFSGCIVTNVPSDVLAT